MADPKVVTALTALFLTEECCHQSSLPLILLDMWVSDSDNEQDTERKRAPLRKYLQHQLSLCDADEKISDSQQVANILKSLKKCAKIPQEDVDTLTRLVQKSFELRKCRRELRRSVLQKYLTFLQKKDDVKPEEYVPYSAAALKREVKISTGAELKRAVRRQSNRPVKRPRKMDL